MENKDIQKQLDEIKEQLNFISGVMVEYQRKQREFSELKDDLTRISKDVFEVATVELEEVSDYFDTRDFLHLVKKLMRNTRNFTKLLNQLESATDFLEDVSPIIKVMFNDLMDSLDEFEKKGYFEFVKESTKIFDTIVTSFSVDDVANLRKNIVFILNTVKGMTQPDILHTINNALSFYKNMDIHVEQDISLWQLMKELKSPETRRAMTFALRFLKNFANQNQQLTT